MSGALTGLDIQMAGAGDGEDGTGPARRFRQLRAWKARLAESARGAVPD